MSYAKRQLESMVRPKGRMSLGASKMKPEFDMELDPLQTKALLDFFRKLPYNIQKNAFKAATKRAAERARDKSEQILELLDKVDTGRLVEALKVKNRGQKYGGNFQKFTVGVSLGKSRKDKAGAYYAPFIEYGHRVVTRSGVDTGKKIEPTHFLYYGLRDTSKKSIQDFQAVLMMELEKRARRLPKAKRQSLGI